MKHKSGAREWGRFLAQHLDLERQKALAFELAADAQVFADLKRQGVKALIEEFERQGRLRNLFSRASEGQGAPPIPPDLPDSIPFGKAQVICLGEGAVYEPQLGDTLTQELDLSVGPVIVGAARDGAHTRLLIGLPQQDMVGWSAGALNIGENLVVERFGDLKPQEQARWRQIVLTQPPPTRHAEGQLYPHANWDSQPVNMMVVGGVMMLAVGAGLCLLCAPRAGAAWMDFQTAWAAFAHQARLWIEFLGSLLGSLLALAALMIWGLVLFKLACYALQWILKQAARRFPHWARLSQARDRVVYALQKRLFWVETVGNLLVGPLAVGSLGWLLARPPDGWDWGIALLLMVGLEWAIWRQMPTRIQVRLSAWLKQILSQQVTS